jgi:hypothetical protein
METDEIPVAAPLQSWRLQCFVPEEQLNVTGQSAMTGLLGGLIAVAHRPMGRLNVILSEGQRLSRLIGNVLTFARQKRQSLQPHRQLLVPDELIMQIVDRFRPALDSLAIRTARGISRFCSCYTCTVEKLWTATFFFGMLGARATFRIAARRTSIYLNCGKESKSTQRTRKSFRPFMESAIVTTRKNACGRSRLSYVG